MTSAAIEHYWRDLPGPIWFSGADIFARFVRDCREPAVAVELGAWKGRSTACMGVEIARSGKTIAFHSVDHWLGSEEASHSQDADLAAGRLYEVFLANIAPVRSHVHVISGDSADAAAAFADGSIDFLYVDASHSYDGVLRDLVAWYPKVREGGLIAGDDWCFEGPGGELSVRLAVLDFFGRAAADITVHPGSAPTAHWLQWSIVKSARNAAPGARLGAKRALRRAQRLLPTRVRRALRSN
jgi:hypothetical protein